MSTDEFIVHRYAELRYFFKWRLGKKWQGKVAKLLKLRDFPRRTSSYTNRRLEAVAVPLGFKLSGLAASASERKLLSRFSPFTRSQILRGETVVKRRPAAVDKGDAQTVHNGVRPCMNQLNAGQT